MLSNSIEQWRPVVGFEDSYEVSDLGRVRSVPRIVVDSLGRTRKLRSCVIAPTAHPESGRLMVNLSKGGRSPARWVARLVALAWIPNPDNLPEVNHIDLCVTNNVVTNLEWVTGNGNFTHAYERGRMHAATNPLRAKVLTQEAVDLMREMQGAGWSYGALALLFDVSRMTAYDVCSGELWPTHTRTAEALV